MTNHELFDEVYKLWFSWPEHEDYAQFLYLVEFERRQTNIKSAEQQEIEYFSALIEEFEKTGEWKKLKS